MLKKITLIITVLLALIFALYFLLAPKVTEAPQGEVKIDVQNNDKRPWILINDKKLYVEIAATDEKRALGLSNRQSIKKNEAMLFVFGKKIIPSFWMNEMKFALDFIWIADNTVIGATENISPPAADEPLETYKPPAPVNYVLEVNAGWVEENFTERKIENQTIELNIL